jgi:hypothetical protein
LDADPCPAPSLASQVSSDSLAGQVGRLALASQGLVHAAWALQPGEPESASRDHLSPAGAHSGLHCQGPSTQMGTLRLLSASPKVLWPVAKFPLGQLGSCPLMGQGCVHKLVCETCVWDEMGPLPHPALGTECS